MFYPVAKINHKGSGSSELGLAERVGIRSRVRWVAHAPTEGASPLVCSPRGGTFPPRTLLFESHPLSVFLGRWVFGSVR